VASVVIAAAGEAGDSTTGSSDSLMGLAACGATEEVAALHPASSEWKLMSALLVGNSEIDAGLTPLETMGSNPAAAMAVLGDKVGQFVQEGLLHLGIGNFPQGGIEPDFLPRGDGDAGGGTHTGIPAHTHHPAELRGHGNKERGDTCLELSITPPGWRR